MNYTKIPAIRSKYNINPHKSRPNLWPNRKTLYKKQGNISFHLWSWNVVTFTVLHTGIGVWCTREIFAQNLQKHKREMKHFFFHLSRAKLANLDQKISIQRIHRNLILYNTLSFKPSVGLSFSGIACLNTSNIYKCKKKVK